MDNWKYWVFDSSNRPFVLSGLLVMFLVLPIALVLVNKNQNYRSSAAVADKLETEGGALSSSGVSKQTDSQASGREYVAFQNQTNPIPTTITQTGTVYNVPTSIDRTGSTDVTTALNNWIATVPSGTASNPSIIMFPAGGIYKMSQGIRITGNYKTLDGRGTKIFTSPGSGTTVTPTLNTSNILVGMNWPGTGSTQSNNIVVHDFILEGDHPAPGTWDNHPGGENQANIFVGLSNGLKIYNITASKSRGDYIDFSGYGNSNAHVYNFTGINCGRNALSFLNSTDMLVENSSWGICAYYWIDFEADNSLGGIRNTDRITIRNNTFERWDASSERYGGGWIALSNAARVGSTDDIKIEGNRITGSHHATMQVYINQNSPTRFKNISFINNSAVQSLPRTGSNNQRNFVFQAKNIDGFVVTGNKQPGAGTSIGGYWFDPSLGSTTQPYNTTGFVFTGNTN